MRFAYSAIDKSGRRVEDVVEARDRIAAIRAVELLGYCPVSVGDERVDAAAHRNPGKTSPTATGVPLVRDWVVRSRDNVADFLARHLGWFERGACGAGMGLALAATFADYPLGQPGLAIIIVLILAGITLLHASVGVWLSLAAMFFAMAFHCALLGYLFGLSAVVLGFVYGLHRPGRAIVVLLAPFLLHRSLGWTIPLVGGFLLPPAGAATLAVLSAVSGLGYMIFRGLSRLGPLVFNYGEVAPLVTTPATGGPEVSLLSFAWLSQMAPRAQELSPRFLSELMPQAFQPPLGLIQIIGWGVAAFVVARLQVRRSASLLCGAFLAGAVTLLLADGLVRRLPGCVAASPNTVAGNLATAAAAAALVGFVRLRRTTEDVASETAYGAPVPKGAGWDAIGGLDDVKEEIRMAVQHHFDKKANQMAKHYGLKSVKGILFYGPPGCGKTMFARTVAAQGGARFFSVAGADFRSKWYGEAEKNIAKVFEEARQNTPAVIFFDEIENMLGKREQTLSSDSPERRVVAQFLAEMDGMRELRDVLVIGATNEPDLMDPAALRPGRFDKLIYIPLPDAPARESIFRVQLRGKPIAADVDFGQLAACTERFSGADIADVCSKVAEQCLFRSLQSSHGLESIAMAALLAQIKSTKPSVSLRLVEKYEALRETYNRRSVQSRTGSHETGEVYTWNSIGGLRHVRAEMVEAIELPLRKTEVYARLKIHPPKGVLLFGPPGCGKTLMAKVVAHECGAHFLSVDARKESAVGIRDWFIRARENKPCVLFFDEIDSVAIARDAGLVAESGVVTQLLLEMDGMKDLKQVVVVAATNRPDVLDPALLRPGRFDRVIYVPPPDVESREQILRVHLKEKPLAPSLDIAAIAQRTEGYSGADLASLCYEAAMDLVREATEDNAQIETANFLKALGRIQPSVRPETLDAYARLRDQFRRGGPCD